MLAAASVAVLLAGLLPAWVVAATPEAVDDAYTVSVDSGTTALDVLANDTGDALTISAVTDPPHGTAVIHGSGVDYTPDAAFHGTDTFDYTVEDGVAAPDTATVTVIVNSPPVAVDDPGLACQDPSSFGGGFPIPEDFRRPSVAPGDLADYFVFFGTCALLANDSDPDGDPLTYEILSPPGHGDVIKIDEEWFAYRPDPDYSTPPGDLPGRGWDLDAFTYRAFDGLSYSAPASMRFWVAPINDPPVFTAGPSAVVVAEDSGPHRAPWASDVRPGPPNEANQAVHFEVTRLDVTGVPDLFAVDPAIEPDGTLTFTPGPDQYGLAHVTVRAKDDGGLSTYDVAPSMMVPPDDTSDEVTFDIVVTPVPDPPIANPDSVTVATDPGPTEIPVLSNDTDADGDVLAIAGVTPAAHGIVGIAAGGTGLTYAPAAGYVGPDSFVYTVSDGNGGSAEGHVSVSVMVPNHAPSGADATVTTDEDVAYVVRAADLGFSDPDDTPADALAGVRIATLPAAGILTVDGVPVTVGQVVPTAGIAAGELAFTPARDASGAPYADFAFQVQDDGGTEVGGVDLDPTPRTITIDVAPVNDDPLAGPDSAAVDEDSQPTAIDVLGNDTDVDDPTLTVTGATNGTKGTVAVTAGGTAVTYRPNLHAIGSDSFTYQVSDAHGASATGTVSVTITPIEHAPNAANDAGLTVPEGAGPTALAVLANDSDLDGDTLTIVGRTNGAHGTVTILPDGSGLTYAPVARYVGTDVFTYQVSDGHGGTDSATVLVTVVRDGAAPTVTAPVQRLPVQKVGLASTRVRLSWSGSDAGSGVARYQLQVSLNGGPFRTVALPSATTTSIDRTIATGPAYRYRVRATDREGNTSAYRYGPTFRAARSQESSSTVSFNGSWTPRSSSPMLGGRGRSSTSTTARVRFTRYASDLAWVATKTRSSGSAQVWVDGVLEATVNLRAASTTYRQLVFARHFAAVGTHIVEIRPVGGGRVDLDAFVALR